MRDNMSTALVSAFYEVSDALYNNYKLQNPPPTTQRHLKLESRAVGTPINGVLRRHSTSSANITNGNIVNTPNTNVNVNDVGKLRDRAMSESDRNQRTQTSRYKTELCRPFEENGTCKYGDKCQFAHGMHELRNLSRHPKYKSELCRTFHTVGFCPYGPRCHFIHNPEERKLGVAFAAAEQAKLARERNGDHHHVERPKLLHFPSAPVGSTCGGDLTPPSSDSPTSMTPPPSMYGDDMAQHINMPLSVSMMQSVFNFTQGQRNHQEQPELPNMMSPIMSPTISGVNSPFGPGPMSPFTPLQQLSPEIEQQSLPSFPPPSVSRQDSSVFFPESNNLNDYSRNTFRPPSPPDSLSDPESSVDSMGPASPTPQSNIPITNPSSSSSANLRLGRLPIFRGMSHEERF
ncbi:mRNA decay activator protein ZFP36L1-like [Asterias rubens]|uniref:mRNA decay activator protein ZFP36L1-like n=1 Tax=Asterias rubens TaxID=7604 RepID=UPI001455C5E8|nr:mRNA decay activator protein ZFP36L1-like [Asterias rubens]